MQERRFRIIGLLAAAALVFAVGCERKDGKDRGREGKRKASTPESVEEATEVLGRIQPLETDQGGKVTKAGLVMDDEKILVLATDDPDVDWNSLVGARLRITGKIVSKDETPGTLQLKLKNLDILEVAANVELEKLAIRDASQVDPEQKPLIRGLDGQLRTQEEIDKQEKAQEKAQEKSAKAQEKREKAQEKAQEDQARAQEEQAEKAEDVEQSAPPPAQAPAQAPVQPPAPPPADQTGAVPVAPVQPEPIGTQTTIERTEVLQQPAPAAPVVNEDPVVPPGRL